MTAIDSPSVGIDRETGGTLTDWAHVLQSLGDIFTTRFGERVLREYYGSAIPKLLGQQLTPREVVPYFAAICAAIEMWEPRFRVTKIDVLSVTRTGRLSLFIDGVYRPRACFGDFRTEGPRKLTVDFDRDGRTRVEEYVE
jgi:uncharacterized protein